MMFSKHKPELRPEAWVGKSQDLWDARESKAPTGAVRAAVGFHSTPGSEGARGGASEVEGSLGGSH